MAVIPILIPNSYHIEHCKAHHAFPSVVTV